MTGRWGMTGPSVSPSQHQYGNGLDGLEAFARHLAPIATVNALTSGRVYLSYCTAVQTKSLTTARVLSGNTAAAATPTLIRMGLYTVAANGDITLVASTPNDTALLNATFTLFSKAYSASYNTIPGQRYAFAILVVSGATMPTLMGPGMVDTTVGSIAPRICARVDGQTDLPASVAVGSLVNESRCYWMGAS